MKKIIAVFTILTIILGMFLFVNKTYAAEKAIDDTTESKLVEIKIIKKNMDLMHTDWLHLF